MLLNKDLKEAYKDYKYLLNRGYSRKIALELISSRYFLSELQRLILYRCTHSDNEISYIQSKISTENNIVVDGFNIAITLINILDNDNAFLCDDGFIRDLGLGKKKEDERILDILILVSEYCVWKKFSCEIILDSQISNSGKIAEKLRQKHVTAKTVNKADKEVIISNKTIASNDFVILMNSSKIVDLLGKMVKDSYIKLVKIPEDLS
ncbi:DUF434 domain-containing protein [Acidianus brierleyi]|uniref:DUF434 domain-containing protein n=1 Tax=Acidianus brierleyi TaxID=41673 RepID=A0A2U9IFU5_9CREN|nr:DUF434 domain-containing protein [Acidianus brierleyi]AWR94918.1 DUF434 domain-containing protein [Acidianus brierleyi]